MRQAGRALAAKRGGMAESDVVEVRWRPFQLNARREGVGSKRDMYLGLFGSEERVLEGAARLEREFAALGAPFEEPYSLGGLVGNTFDAHRVAAWAEKTGGFGGQDLFMGELMADYFTRERNVADAQVLRAAAERAGLDGEEAAAVISDPQKYASETRAQMCDFGAGVRGVPYFIVRSSTGGRRYTMSGAQPANMFEELLDEILDGE